MNKIKLMVLLFVATGLTAGLSAQTLDEVTAKYNEAGAALQAREFEKAAGLFEQVIQQGALVGADAQATVNNAQTHLMQSLIQTGSAYASQQNFPKAIEFLQKAAERSELYGNAQLMRTATQRLGLVYFASGADAYNNERYEEAIKIFSEGFAADDTNTDMGLNLARSYDKMDSLEKAIETYGNIIALESRHSRYAEPAKVAKEELGLAVLERASKAAAAGDLDGAINFTTMALEVDPTNAAAQLMRLQMTNNKKDYKAIIEYGEAAAEAQTDDALKSDAYFMLGAAYQNQGNTPKAIEAFRKVTAGSNAAQARSLISELNK